MLQRPLSALMALSLLAACAPDNPPPDTDTTGRGLGTFAALTQFGSNPGNLGAYLYVPTNPASPAPLVVALHSCSLTAALYRGAGWEALADQYGFYVLYPEQLTANNALGCFNWSGEFGDSTNLNRGQGENASIMQMVDTVRQQYAIDSARIFVMGHSAGGAQSMLMAATWPEVFAAAGSIAGVTYDCTRSFSRVSTCLSPGIDKTPQEHGDLVRAARPGYAGPYPRITLWHGDADQTVAPANLRELADQWTNVHGLDQVADVTSVVDGATRQEHVGGGVTRVEVISIPGFAHGTPVRPAQGCGTAGAYLLSSSICAVERMADFFGLIPSVPPTDAGVVVDAGRDAGPRDAASAPDAAPPAVDAATSMDASPPAMDAATAPDAAASARDAAASLDAASPLGDSGSPPDDAAATELDAGATSETDAGTRLDGGAAEADDAGTTSRPPSGGTLRREDCSAVGGETLWVAALVLAWARRVRRR